MDEIIKLIKGTSIAMQTTFPSYIEAFFDYSKGNVAVLHKLTSEMRDTTISRTTVPVSKSDDGTGSSDLPEGDMDLTGSPLAFSVYSTNCDDTTILEGHKCWLSEEENHAPLTIQEARSLISKYFLNLRIKDGLPLWVVCNGLDPQRTLLFSGHRCNGWYNRTLVRYCGAFPFNSPDLQLTSLKEKHYKLGAGLCSKTDVLSVYNIHDSNKHQVIKDVFTVDSDIKIDVKLTWNVASMEIPLDDVTSTLCVQVNVGHDCSEAVLLWQQLVSIQQYVKALEVAKARRCDPVFPNREGGTLGKISKMLAGVECGARKLPMYGMLEPCNLKQSLAEHRRDKDLTDSLWELLTDCRDARELVDSLELVYQEILHNRARPFLRPKNQTTVAQTVTRLMRGQPAVTELTGTRALELLVEMGLEKLVHDYNFIFRRAALVSLEPHLKTLLTNERFCNSATAGTSLLTLARLHASLELLLTVEAYLDLPNVTMDFLAQRSLKSCTERVVSLEALFADRLLVFKVPISFQDVRVILPSYFTSWRLTLLTECSREKITSVFLCSSSFIFPPSICDPECSMVPHDVTLLEEPTYHLFQLTSWNDKLR